MLLKAIHIVEKVEKIPKNRSGIILRSTIRKIIHHEEFPLPPTIEYPFILYIFNIFKQIFNYSKSKA